MCPFTHSHPSKSIWTFYRDLPDAIIGADRRWGAGSGVAGGIQVGS